MNIVKSLFDNIAERYDFMNNIISFCLHKNVKRYVLKQLKIKPNSKVLDLCCGTGDLGAIVKDIMPSCDVVGVDFSHQMLEIARKKHPNITFWEADVTDLKFEKNSFDYIIMGFGLRNIPQKNKVLEQIYKILKTNGYFLHVDFGKKNFFSKIHDNLIIFFSRLFLKNTKPYKYLVISKNNFLEPEELVELFKFNRFNYVTHKNIILDLISYQIVQK